ncbi:sigma-70 family RNA polymerase sigma factor [Pedobacter sp. Du54]|uniref:sigma-70 family RNA polymerase sigma factor n=1 Tax=Pedobacter anseongensis TaxID=3133439 RepID=UPI00309705EC
MANYQKSSDQELISLLRESDSRAYTEIYDRYFKLVFLHALKKTSDVETAKDIVQELFVNLWEKRQTFSATSIAAYLITAARNKALDHFSHRQVVDKYASSLAIYSATITYAQTDHLVREKQLHAHIEKEVQSLPKKMQHIFRLSREEQLSNIEISKQLSTSESNISKQLANATKILKTKLSSFLTSLII